nr:MAG TPA: hypothetical protein [Caudoviricetes sp.]
MHKINIKKLCYLLCYKYAIICYYMHSLNDVFLKLY